jgi:type II secretory pathway pseudopilin PulG
MPNRKGTTKFAFMMIVLAVIAVLMGVAVLYWMMQLDAARLPEAQVLSLLDLGLLIA